jgi:excinuclease ABC subunit C
MYSPESRLTPDRSRIPQKPGVYLMMDSSGTVLYVGKAKNLKKRVASYFRKNQDSKTSRLVSRIKKIETIITDNEVEAFILENNLIKEHRPRYNVELRENRSYYPYIKVTSETYPRVLKTRTRQNDGALYFGPYSSAGAVTRTLKTISDIFPVRRCRVDLDRKKTGRPCLNHTIGRCYCPCCGHISPEEYAGLIDEVVLFLKGQSDKLLSRIEEEMHREAEKTRFEEALRLKNRYQALKQLVEDQKITLGSEDNEDIVGLAEQDGVYVITVMFRRNGKIIGKRDFSARNGTSGMEVVEEFLRLHYSEPGDLPSRILLPFKVPGVDLLKQYFSEKHGKKIGLVVPERGMKRRLVELASTNAAHTVQETALKSRKTAAHELKKVLDLPMVPRTIEAFDAATLLGEHSVAAMVRFSEGKFDRKNYRRFMMKYGGGDPSDVAMISEAVARRCQRLMNEQQPLPDLILVDGGKPQVGAALEVLGSLGLDIPVVGLAKQHEHLYTRSRDPIVLEKRNNALRLLMSLRDEAHRFAHTYHLNLRAKRTLATKLEQTPGVGSELAATVLRALDNLEGPVTLQFLRTIRGVGEQRARSIFKAIGPEADTEPR